MLEHLSPDIICSSKLKVFLEVRSRKSVRFLEQIISKEKYPSIFSRHMEAIVSLSDPFTRYSDSGIYSKRFTPESRKYQE